MNIYLYGPPGSGKSTLGQLLAERLDLPFCDLDSAIAEAAGKTIPQIFADEGETHFRQLELDALREASAGPSSVVALGGGALLNPQARAQADASGQLICLNADLDALLARLGPVSADRPLLTGSPKERLQALLEQRAAHYASFPHQLNTTQLSLEGLAWQALLLLGRFRVHGMGQAYDVVVQPGGMDQLGQYLQDRGLGGPVAVVSDRFVGSFYQEQVVRALAGAGYEARFFAIEPGEVNKTLDTVRQVWNFFIHAGIDRGSTIVALGGGVVGDLTGFAAATFLRGIAWVNVPTSLLAMVDSSLGGKTGIDLPEAKNLVGAFYPPRLVLVDPDVLETLPERELRNGLGEVVKHGVIDDPTLFELCAQGWSAARQNLEAIVRQGMAVKLKVIEEDPYEKGLRQALNLGHTIGHGVELASDFHLSHGEAVAIGMVAEARIAEGLGLASAGLGDGIAAVLQGLGLPVTVPENLSPSRIIQAMRLDKKRAAGKVRFALPVQIGEVRTGVVVENWQDLVLERMWS